MNRMGPPRNSFFVGREAELARFTRLLTSGELLTVLNVHGHSGVGKTWLLEEFRSTCNATRVPFAYLNPRQMSGDPVSLLTSFAQRMGLEGAWRDSARTFDQLLPSFVAALHALDTPVVMLMLDNYDQMLHFDPHVRHLIRRLAQSAPPNGSNGSLSRPAGDTDQPLDRLGTPPRFIVVIGSQIPLREHWPLSPIYLQPLQEMALCDFALRETSAYLTRMGVPQEHHLTLFRLTQGYPLALALVALSETSRVVGTPDPIHVFLRRIF